MPTMTRTIALRRCHSCNGTPPRARSSPACSTSIRNRKTCTPISTLWTRHSTSSTRRRSVRALPRSTGSTPACARLGHGLMNPGLNAYLRPLDRSTDSSQTSRQVRETPYPDLAALANKPHLGIESHHEQAPPHAHLREQVLCKAKPRLRPAVLSSSHAFV